MNYYDILGVPSQATPDQIRTAYRALVQLFHPDRLRHLRPEVRSFAEERLKTLNQAYEVLGDSDKRAVFDRGLAGGASAPAPGAPRGTPPSQHHYEPPPRPVGAQDRQERRDRLERQIIEVDRSLRALLLERDRTHAQFLGEQQRSVRRFWLITSLTTLTAGAVVAYGLWAVPTLPLTDVALNIVFAVLVIWHEFITALALAVACRPAGTRLNLLGIVWTTGRAGLVALAVGLVGWLVWGLTLQDTRAPASLLVLAAVTVVTHVVYCWLAQGGQIRVALEKRRLYDQANDLVRRAYEHELSALRARRAALELE